MKIALKVTTFIFFLIALVPAMAQTDKMDEAAELGNFKRLEKVCLDALEDRELKRNPITYYYLAQAYVNLGTDPLTESKYPDGVKLSVKYMEKGIRKDDNRSLLESDFTEVLDAVIKAQIKEGEGQFGINKKSKAVRLFDKAYELDSSRRYPYFMSAKSAVESGGSASGEHKYKQLMVWYAADQEVKDSTTEQELDPYLYFADKYFQSAKYDSAKYMIAAGRTLFGNDSRLNYFQKNVVMAQLKFIPPSTLMLNYIQEVLLHNPDDKDLLQKENALYIYLIKNKVNRMDTAEIDTILNTFVREKVAKSKLKAVRTIAEVDVFVEKKPENVLWKLAEYFQTYTHLKSAKYVLDKYISTTAKSKLSDDVEQRWNVIAKYAFDTKEFPYASFVLQQAILKYPLNTELSAKRTQVIAEKEVVRTTVEEQATLYSLMKDEYKIDTTAENLERIIAINEKYIGLLMAANRFSTAKGIMAEKIVLAPDIDHSRQLRLLAKEDFYQNYFNTRTQGKDINGEEIPPYSWNGRSGGCDEGIVDFEIQSKVADRINYFRRNAGVPEVLFDEATNEYCQKAALMMASNNKLEHDPPRTWRCWSNDGAYAAKHSLLIKDANTSLAVTYIMDDKNPTAGNRRWLLYPNGKVYGHGSTNDYAVIWALDDSGSADTAEYMDVPVAWPPKGHVPQLMLFTNWTFSIYRDLTNAKVEVIQDGKVLEVQVEPFLRGYGAPTLVFKPKYDKTALVDRSTFDVTVTLSDGRKYNYSVHSFAYDPMR
jgi:uncharacterized protein YkwD